uniref:Cysteine protease n=2 Tax=Opisthorchis viverrini TaxID=6198 RepID=Q5PXS3_OPIVI|nr:cysteine protease [Opisthorchis viverrini]ACN68966.1 cathepsin F-like cysteine protease [Opisthorchis viverrini]
MRPFVCCVLVTTIWSVFARTTPFEPDDARALYEEFKLKYKKTYSNDDDELRFRIFKDNLERAKRLQAMEQGTAEYGVTQFSDLTSEEFKTRYLRMRFDEPIVNEDPTPQEDVTMDNSNFDWRDHGAVGPVLDQGDCGSCWAFSVIGNVEGQWFRKTGDLLGLSEQQLIDCDHSDQGCDGGYPPQTYSAIEEMGGLELRSDYPYTGKDGICYMDQSKFVAYVNGSTRLPWCEKTQAKSLKEIGPLSSGLNAVLLQLYKRGIMRPRWCNPAELNHAVLTVGYGMEHRMPYWIVKNSWGKRFGEKGYFRIYRGDGTCGINRAVTTAVVK